MDACKTSGPDRDHYQPHPFEDRKGMICLEIVKIRELGNNQDRLLFSWLVN